MELCAVFEVAIQFRMGNKVIFVPFVILSTVWLPVSFHSLANLRAKIWLSGSVGCIFCF